MKRITNYFYGTGLIVLMVFLIPKPLQAQQENGLIDAFQQSYTLEKNGEYADAAESLKKVYNQDGYEINLRLGWLTYQAGLFNESIGYYSRAVALMPYSIEPRLGAVLPAAALGNWEQVVNQYNKILEIDPQNTLVNYRMGVIHYERAEYQKAESYFEKVINLYPWDHDSLLMMAWTKLKLVKTREARVLFNKVLMYNPADDAAKEGLSYLK